MTTSHPAISHTLQSPTHCQTGQMRSLLRATWGLALVCALGLRAASSVKCVLPTCVCVWGGGRRGWNGPCTRNTFNAQPRPSRAPTPPHHATRHDRVALDPLADESHSIARAVAEGLQGDDAAALLAPEDDARSSPFVWRRAAWMSRAQAKKKKKKKKAKAKAAGTAVDVKSVTDGKPRQPNCAWQAHVTGSNINAGKIGWCRPRQRQPTYDNRRRPTIDRLSKRIPPPPPTHSLPGHALRLPGAGHDRHHQRQDLPHQGLVCGGCRRFHILLLRL